MLCFYINSLAIELSMRKIQLNVLPNEVVKLITEENPMYEDIGILGEKGELKGVVITPEAYSYFLKKVEEDEDKEDLEFLDNFDSKNELDSAQTLDDFLKDEG